MTQNQQNYLSVAYTKNQNKNSTSNDNRNFYTTGKEASMPIKNIGDIPQGTSPRLRLKDYLRLQTITKRSNSAASSRKKDSANSSPEKNSTNIFDTKQSMHILKEELKTDLNLCIEKATQLLNKVQKNDPKLQNNDDEYAQLVFLCELHRIVKQNIQSSLEKAHQLVYKHKQNQFLKFTSKANDLLSEQIKKSTYSSSRKKRNSMMTSIRPHKGDQSKLDISTFTAADKLNEASIISKQGY